VRLQKRCVASLRSGIVRRAWLSRVPPHDRCTRAELLREL
jgi:hypothetical protein